MERVSETLHRFKELAQSHNVEQLVIAATSAVREASKLNNLSEHKSHFLALKSTEIFGHMIK